ncbi:CCA tRNA nucleotidyltransferase [Bhargavaea cecembensis]|uniref:CCA tRNA nucleotidyltransferase n=1 Tax=Bhargavaea cecembensis TaxID=394098 RepID=UPI00058C26A4|nr:CCA tRNA nucleotidyltransferase [Bhargavaea cecembensis]
MTAKIWEAAFSIVGTLREAGFEAVIVGGAVRDRFMGLPADDVDVATSALPEQVKSVFPKTADVGITHGTVLVIHPDAPVEVTTFRTEGTYTDHRRPDSVEYVQSLKEDLRRRDFTMNAIALRDDGSYDDPFGGRQDIRDGIIRAVGDPDERFGEDALRMLRAVRFAARTGFRIEEGTYAAIGRHAKSIRAVSVERVKMELDKVWVSGRAALAVRLLAQTGLAHWLPLMEPERLMQNLPVWERFGKPERPVDGWALLSLLAGSPEGNPYKLSNAEKLSLRLIRQAYEIRSARPYRQMDIYRLPAEALKAGWHFAWLTGQAPPANPDEIDRLKARLPIGSMRELEVTGNELIGWTGRKGGPWIKEWLGKIEEAVVTEKIPNHRDDIKGWFMNGIESEG